MDYKTALPPRKRAKTVEEKEQRRIERILRNRRAAHASREKKRRYVEYLESYIERLTGNLANYQYNQEYLLSQVPDKSLVESSLKAIDDLKSFEADFAMNDKSSKKIVKLEQHDDDQLVSPPVSEVEINSSNNVSFEHEYNGELDLNYGQQESATNTNHSEGMDELVNEEQDNEVFSDEQKNSSVSTDSFEANLLFNPIDNYLSPVSIDSPVNSPINLSLYDSSLNDLEHNSEVVVDNMNLNYKENKRVQHTNLLRHVLLLQLHTHTRYDNI